ncbi:MAG: lipoprotein [Halomonas sp.]|nr:lipoprotein [Halomonas sp.]MCC5901730.1 lipoprotein [Halomonas sp.]
MKCYVTKASVVLLAALLLVGCGQKGPLYLPDDNAFTANAAAAQED